MVCFNGAFFYGFWLSTSSSPGRATCPLYIVSVPFSLINWETLFLLIERQCSCQFLEKNADVEGEV
jgi:hypothetical protein